MVQRKAPDKPKAPIEHKESHGRLDRQFSSHLQQDTRARSGADHKKKLMKVKSIKVSDLDSFEGRKTSSIPIRNYMKSTSSSDARKEKLQVTVNSPVGNYKKKSTPRSSKKSNASSVGFSSPRAVKALSRQSSLKPVKSSMKKCSVVALCAKKNVNRATCSSTLKDSKFPSALELNHGATEAEGTSKIRVCPYTYCSLNGHIHEPLPPLKCFISARRKLLKTQRSLKVKGLLSFKTSLLQKERKMIDDELEDEISKNPSDLFVEIITMPQEETVGEYNYDEISIIDEKYHEQCMPQFKEYSDMSFDQNSEFSQDEMDDVMMNFLEYVELDHGRTTAKKDYEEDGEIRKPEIKTIDMNWEEEICSFPDNTQMSECPDEQFSADDDSESEERNSQVFEKEDSNIPEFNSQSIDDDVQKLSSKTTNCQSDDIILEDEAKNPERELQEDSKGTDRNILNVSAIDYNEIDGALSSRWSITKKKTTEEFEQVKEFNPRPPNFLPLEPDPEAEKVDLRHQTMDGRRNSEEWMIDYALQQAVTRLGPARKKKVALLVEAFETVVPLPMCEKPLSHGTTTFNHLSFVQACN
ncbi:calmodulin binding protein PICBP [Dendrobium catenatum]|uniref:Calmodulin-binding domain-containing protein n=1 Tax=Dendrobium catenatum TaxID=906689 RepID=A0A2I0WL80_9ASPA|nr:calmodulin binding protein PICBP [Dendrobium catenatum]PKU76415.1 hypothetical protein MA16_Dca001018 [Dendrobium catenatum]